MFTLYINSILLLLTWRFLLHKDRKQILPYLYINRAGNFRHLPLHWLTLSWHQASPVQSLSENKAVKYLQSRTMHNSIIQWWVLLKIPIFSHITISLVENVFGRFSKISIAWGDCHSICKSTEWLCKSHLPSGGHSKPTMHAAQNWAQLTGKLPNCKIPFFAVSLKMGAVEHLQGSISRLP